MTLAQKIKAPKVEPLHGKPCSIGVLVANLKGAELDALNTMLASPDWSQYRIWKALTEEGHTVGLQTINRHRGGRCRCGR